MSSPRRSIAGVALFPLLAAVLAWAWAELRYSRVVPPHSNLFALIALVVSAGVGVGYFARRSGQTQAVVALLVVLGLTVSALTGVFAMLYVAAGHGDLG